MRHWYKKHSDVISLVIVVIFALLLSFIVTAGIIKLISLCFGFTFSWKLALGIWLALSLLGSFLGGRSK